MQSCLNWKHSTPSQDLILMFALFGTLHACSDDGTRLMFGRSCKDLENGIQNRQKDRQSRQFGYSTVPFLGWESSTTCRHNIFPKLRRRKNFPYSYFCRRTSSCDPLTSCDGITWCYPVKVAGMLKHSLLLSLVYFNGRGFWHPRHILRVTVHNRKCYTTYRSQHGSDKLETVFQHENR